MDSEAAQRIAACKTKEMPYLDLSRCSLQSIPQELAELDWLQALSLSQNQIEDISLLSQLPHLHKLSLSHNRIGDISALRTLTKMKFLFLHHNAIDDLTPLAQIKRLKKLVADHNRIEDISPLMQLPELVYLDLRENLLHTDTQTLKKILPQLMIAYA
ncbi:MAG: leucine-rich repeat domain-containing protein [Sulfurovum sp.]|nr:leucine-rich repeat domain-containing protein [Sulfurovum sp.]